MVTRRTDTALDLYLRDGMVDKRHPEVIRLSSILNQLNTNPSQPDPERFRNPNGVAMKLANFARFDPDYDGKGLQRGGASEEGIWNEFANDPAALAREVSAIKSRITAQDDRSSS